MHYQVKSADLTTVSSVMEQILFSFGLIIYVLIDKIKSLYKTNYNINFDFTFLSALG